MNTETVAEDREELPKYRFRIRSGTYWKPEPVVNEETGQPLRDKDNNIVTKDVIYGPKRPAGDIVDVNINLAKRFNTPGRQAMFELLGVDDNPLVGQLIEMQERVEASERRYRRALASMSQRELLDHAKLEGVNLQGEVDERRVRVILLRAAGLDPNVREEPTNANE